MEPLVSVIILTYNQERTITRALDSVLNQQCKFPYEIIVGDDCSSDNTRNICLQYAQKHPNIIRLFPHDKNKGVVKNYFDCFRLCKGKYIADCAGDDFWTDNYKLQKQVDILEADQTVTLVHTDWNYFNETKCSITPSDIAGKYKNIRKPIIHGKELIRLMFDHTSWVIQLSTALYRKEIIVKHLAEDPNCFDGKDWSCEDYQITFILAMEGNIAFINSVTLNYCIGHKSVMHPGNERETFLFALKMSKLRLYLAHKYSFSRQLIKQVFQPTLFALFLHLFRSNSIDLVSVLDAHAKDCGGYGLKCKIGRTVVLNKGLNSIAQVLRRAFISIKKFRTFIPHQIK